MAEPKNKPLVVSVADGVLTIEIGVDVLAFAALRSPYAWDMFQDGNPTRNGRPDDVYRITDATGFANDVKDEMTAELGEDGSSLLFNFFDAAAKAAIEQGSAHFAGDDE